MDNDEIFNSIRRSFLLLYAFKKNLSLKSLFTESIAKNKRLCWDSKNCPAELAEVVDFHEQALLIFEPFNLEFSIAQGEENSDDIYCFQVPGNGYLIIINKFFEYLYPMALHQSQDMIAFKCNANGEKWLFRRQSPWLERTSSSSINETE